MTDRTGMSYEELLKIQEQHILQWAKIVLPVRMQQVAEYVRAMNRPAKDATEKHRVYRGQDLIEIIRTWDNRNREVYPDVPVPTAEDGI